MITQNGRLALNITTACAAFKKFSWRLARLSAAVVSILGSLMLHFEALE